MNLLPCVAVLLAGCTGVVMASEARLDIGQLHRDAATVEKAYRCAAIAYGAESPNIERQAPALLEIGENALATVHAYLKQNPISENQDQKVYLDLLKTSSLEFLSGMTLAQNSRDISDETGRLPDIEGASVDFGKVEQERALRLNDLFVSESCVELGTQ